MDHDEIATDSDNHALDSDGYTSDSDETRMDIDKPEPPANEYDRLHDLRKGTLTKLNKYKLRERLADAGIPFDEEATKPELQALCALFQQEVLSSGEEPDSDLLQKVIEWIKKPVADVKKLLEERKLDVTGHKWDHIEVLITDELNQGKSAAEKAPVSNEPDASPTTLSPSLTHPKTTNLLVAMIREHIFKYSHASLEGCPIQSTNRLFQHLNTIPAFNTQHQVEDALANPTTEARELFSWICTTFRREIAVASDDFLIHDMPKEVAQFVLVKPNKNRHQNFIQKLRKKKSESILLFHGTPLSNLFSILKDGFKPAADERFGVGLFMGEEPSLTYHYALKESWRNQPKPTKPYSSWGVVLGCQVPGDGRTVNNQLTFPSGVHVIKDMESIAIRYIFLVPAPARDQLQWRNLNDNLPKRAVIRAQMTKAFRRFPAVEM